MTAIAGVVIPAHNEAQTIGLTLSRLAVGVRPGDLDVVVVCNGCSDDTAALARASYPTARVIEVPRPSKAEAVRVGNAAGTVFPRVHLDADVRISGVDVLALVRPLREGVSLATAPVRVLHRDDSSLPVRWFYDVWEQLPQVRAGLFGRGVLALSEEGQRRVDSLPSVMSDDLAVSEAFDPAERRVVETAFCEVAAPRTVRDLVRRRVRVATGVVQADRLGVRHQGSSTTLSALLDLGLHRPRLLPRLPVFLLIGLLARTRSRRAVRAGDFTTWLRDESSRA